MKNLNKFQKNELKNLIYIQENKPCNEQTIKGLFRSIVEPVLEESLEAVILCRLDDSRKSEFSSLLKRLEFSKSRVFDFSNKEISEKFKNVIKNTEIWGKTEFVFVWAQRYGACLIFDFEDVQNQAEIFVLFNSKSLSDVFGIINSNSNEDLMSFHDQYHPDRRENETLNNSLRKLVENLSELNQEIMISEMEKESVEENADLGERFEFVTNKSRYVAHEIRNQLSICDLYSKVIEKQLQRLNVKDAEVQISLANALNCIQKSLRVASTQLIDLKSLNNNELKRLELQELITSSIELSKVYIQDKDVTIEYNGEHGVRICVDEDKFLAVLVNLLKNAIESIEEKGQISVKTTIEGEDVSIVVSNNGAPIPAESQGKIFEDGFTTKTSGTGVGLYICKKSIEEQYGRLKLKKSDEESTDFEIILPVL